MLREAGGQVFDISGRPVRDIVARIHLYNWATEFRTSGDGAFAWPALYHPEYQITLVGSNIRADDVKVPIEDGKRIIVNFREYGCSN